jgi:hypothetical protein
MPDLRVLLSHSHVGMDFWAEGEPRLANKNECQFCYREDHFVNNCPALRRAQKEQENKKDWKGNALKIDDTAEVSNVALVEETDNDSYYLRSVPATAMQAVQQPTWALDSGASRYFTGIQSDFTTIKRWDTPRSVRIVNGTFVPAIGYGAVQLSGILLKEVWFVPQFKTTRLISVRTLTRTGYRIVFDTDDRASCIHRETRILAFHAYFNGGLYVTRDSQEAYEAGVQTPIDEGTKDTGPLNETESELWHRCLAHSNYNDILKLENASLGMRLKRRIVPVGRRACDGCLAGKMKERLNKSTTSRVSILGAKLHTDTLGRIGLSIRGFRYFLLVCDDATRFT